MTERGFPLPGSSYKELIKIIQGYRQAGQDAVPSDVARVVGIHETIVSRNNRFLVAVGIVQGGKKKSITTTGTELALALEYEDGEQVGAKWREIVEASEFLQKVVAAVKIRKGMDEPSLATHVAYSAGQPKTSAVLTGAGTIVEILKVAGILREETGNLVAARPEGPEPEEGQEDAHPHSQPPAPSTAVPIQVSDAGPGIRLNIEVKIQCTASELEGLGSKLRRVIDDFNRREEETSPSPTASEAEGQTE